MKPDPSTGNKLKADMSEGSGLLERQHHIRTAKPLTGGKNARLVSLCLTQSGRSVRPPHNLSNNRINFAKGRSGRDIPLLTSRTHA